MVIQNIPGGSGTVASNIFTQEAKPDGLTLLMTASGTLGQFTRGGSAIKFDPNKWRSIGSIPRGGSVLMVRKDVRARLNDPKAKPLVVGDSDGIRTWVAMTVWGAEYLGWNLRWVYGYPGATDMLVALRQGEMDVWSTQNSAHIEGLVKDKVVDFICQQDDERRPGFAEVPTFLEVLGSKKPSGVSWQAYEAWTGDSAVDKFLVAPTGTPDAILNVLRDAFVKMGKDPELADQATKFFGEGWSIMPGARTEALIKEVTTTPKEAAEFLAKIRKKYGLPTG